MKISSIITVTRIAYERLIRADHLVAVKHPRLDQVRSKEGIELAIRFKIRILEAPIMWRNAKS